MARPETRWLLSILMVNLQNCLAQPGAPIPPSAPQCQIPHEEYDGMVLSRAIHCVWEPGPGPQMSTTYTLHWKSADDRGQVKGTSMNGFIERHHVSSHSELTVWVQAENQHGVVESEKASFNTADIMKPLAPTVQSHSQEPLEIHWRSQCSLQGLSEGGCEVRHRAEADQGWPEAEGGFHGIYPVENPQPYTVYEFQVRCACTDLSSLMSDWSPIYKVESAGAAPVGKLDVWGDCEMHSRSSECVLRWKELSKLQALGNILGYELRFLYSNSTVAVMNVSTAEPKGQLVCNETQCYLTSYLTGVTAVNVSAYGVYGATSPAYLAIPIPGKENDKQAIRLKMNSETLTVSWDLPDQLTDNLTEYVVQYKCETKAGRLQTQEFDWVRINKSQISCVLTGKFENYTAYHVSLFAVSQNGYSQHLSSAVEYVLQGTPSKVPSFQVVNIYATSVNLSWESIPLLQRKGVILLYQIGVDSKEVYNVSVHPRHKNMTFLLEHLNPGQDYEVWISAVTEAGTGPMASTRFKTKEGYGYITLLLVLTAVPVVACLAIICLIFIWCETGRAQHSNRPQKEACPLVLQCFYEKVPDPRNSHIFQQMKHQFNDSWSWTCIPILEPNPKISHLEVVQIKSSPNRHTSDSDGLPEEVVGVECSQKDRSGDRRMDASKEEWERGGEGRQGFRRDEYSKMIDTDEEDRGEERDESSSLSEEDQCFSGYEKHFLPTTLELLDV